MTAPDHDSGGQQHGNVFSRGWGSMFIHVQRENGLAHRTLVLRPWQVQALRLVVSRWFVAVLTLALLSWAYFAVQTARVPLLTQRISHLEEDAAKIDTLQATLEQLQRRYTQVQQMLSASTHNAQTGSTGRTAAPQSSANVQGKAATTSTKAPDKPAAAPATTPNKVPEE